MQTLYNYVVTFWQFWFGSETLPADITALLSVITTIGIVWLCLLRPFVRLIRGRKD